MSQPPSAPQYGTPDSGDPHSTPPTAGRPDPTRFTPTAPASGTYPAPTHSAKARTIGTVLAIVGAGILVIAVVLGGSMALKGFGAMRAINAQAVDVGGTTTHDFTGGEVMQIYVPENQMPGQCSVVGPADPALGPNVSSTVTMKGQEYSSMAGFEITTAGTYTLTCSNDEAVMAPPVSFGGILGMIGGIFITVIGLILGLVMLGFGLRLRMANGKAS